MRWELLNIEISLSFGFFSMALNATIFLRIFPPASGAVSKGRFVFPRICRTRISPFPGISERFGSSRNKNPHFIHPWLNPSLHPFTFSKETLNSNLAF